MYIIIKPFFVLYQQKLFLDHHQHLYILIKRLLIRGRKDDNEKTIKTRLKIYKENTEPLIEYYKDLSLLENINADGDLKTISADIKRKMA